LGFKNIKILVNDRSSFGDIPNAAITIIDKLDKIGQEEVKKELKAKGFDQNLLEKVKNSKQTDRVKKVFELAKRSRLENEIVFTQILPEG